MQGGILRVALFIAALAFSGQAYGKEGAPQREQNQTAAPALKPPLPAPKREQSAKRCPGSYHPEVDCAAISADADVDQARNAENQTWWFRWEVLLTFLTFIVASLAMWFARSAATHTETAAKKSAEANVIARDTAYRQLRAYLSPGDHAKVIVWFKDGAAFCKVKADLVNNGLTPCTLTARRFQITITTGAHAGSGMGHEIRGAEIVAPRARSPAVGEVGLSTDEPKSVRFKIGYLFTYADYLGRQHTEVITWHSDTVAAMAVKREHPLTLMSHQTGPNKDLRWMADEIAEMEARSAAAKVT